MLNEHNVFNGIDNRYVNNIKTEFDNKVNHIYNGISNADTMITLNKKVISEIITEMTKYKTHIQDQPIENDVNAKDNIPINNADAQLQKQILFQKNLQTKQNEFETLINKPKPNTIDFSDNNGQDKPNASEMERKLAETIAWREKQLNVVIDTQNKTETSISEANKWINHDNISSSENSPILKIDKNTPVDINVINLDNKSKKKVSFPETNEPETFENNFLSLLKKKDTHNTSFNLNEDIIIMKTQIKELINKQNIILENQKVILKIINELQIKPRDNISPNI